MKKIDATAPKLAQGSAQLNNATYRPASYGAFFCSVLPERILGARILSSLMPPRSAEIVITCKGGIHAR